MINGLKNLIDSCEVISFDLFDTLIKRDVVEPKDIYKIIQLTYETNYNKSLEWYAEKRYATEIALWKSQNSIITIDDIYRAIPDISEHDKEIIKEMELKIEADSYRINVAVKDILNYCLVGTYLK